MDKKELVLATIEKRGDDLIELCRQMIRCRPVNAVYAKQHGYDEAEVQKALAARLEKMGVELYSFDVNLKELDAYKELPGYVTGYTDKIDFSNRPNLVARLPGRNPEKGKSILLVGHCDVVAADDLENWDYPPFDAVLENGVLHGRGIVDMLGGLAAMLAFMEAVIECDAVPDGDIWFASAVSEESGGTGCLMIADWLKKKGVRIDAGIMGEPTDLNLSLLCRGIQWGDITIYGKTGHLEVWQPHWSRGGVVDAIEKARYIMDQIDNLNREWALRPDKNHPLLKESCQVKIAVIGGGHHRSSFPGECTLSYNIQVLPHETDENGLGAATRVEFEHFVKRICDADDWLRDNPPKLEWVLEADCSEVDRRDPFAQTFEKSMLALRPESIVNGSGFHTDTGWLMRLLGTPVVNFGPGDPSLAHRTNEHCKAADIVECAKIVAAVCMDWCNEK